MRIFSIQFFPETDSGIVKDLNCLLVILPK